MPHKVNTAQFMGFFDKKWSWLISPYFWHKQKKYEAKKEGYVDASSEYEKKLRQQAELFLKKQIIHKSEMDEFSQLIDNLLNLINELSKGEKAGNSNNRICLLENLIEKLKSKIQSK